MLASECGCRWIRTSEFAKLTSVAACDSGDDGGVAPQEFTAIEAVMTRAAT